MSDPTLSPSFDPGSRVGHFEILKLIKEGGQATVYLARVALPDQPPAQRILWHLKWLGASPEWVKAQRLCVIKLAAPGKRESLIDEHSYLLQVRAALHDGKQSPHLITLFKAQDLKSSDRPRGLEGIWDSPFKDSSGRPLPYIALPYAPGESLDGLLRSRRQRPLPPGTALAIVQQMAEALTFLHQRVHLVHHDISPSNIVFTRQLSAFFPRHPECMLVDLAAADSPQHPRLRTFFGKAIYLPPQRLKKTIRIVPDIDVYGLGVVLYEMLVGQLPQPSTDQTTGLPNPLPPIHQRRPDLSQDLADLVMDTVSHDQRRWPGLEQFKARLSATPELRRSPLIRGPFDRRALAYAFTTMMLVLLLALTLPLALMGSPMVPETPATRTAPSGSIQTVTPLPSVIPTSTPTSVPPTSTPVNSGALRPALAAVVPLHNGTRLCSALKAPFLEYMTSAPAAPVL